MSQSSPDFRILFESLPGSYLILSPDFTVVAASDAYLHMTGIERQQLIGHNIFEIIPDDEGELRASLERVLGNCAADTMPVQKHDVPRPDAGSEECYWRVVNTPVLGADSEVASIIHHIEDVTESERLKQQLAEHTTRMKKALSDLETTTRELDAFTYSISHDLRAPLRAINGFARVLQKEIADTLTSENQHYLDRIYQRSLEMQQMLDELLTLSRLSRQPLARQTLNPQIIVKNVLDGLQGEQEGRALEIVIHELPACNADPLLLRHVFTHLLSNALKFTRKTSPARVEIGSQMDGTECVYFVRDNGAGFDMEYAGKLFSLFNRLHRVDEFEGIGVGLAVVQRIITRHGGRVWAEAAVNQGATFYFTLPGNVSDS